MALVGINLELTDACPFRCRQCYVPTGGRLRELSPDEGLYWIAEAHRCGITHVNLSGGETLCYPHLYRLVAECRKYGMKASVALSGAFFSMEKLIELKEAGISGVCVSLNGSTEEINEKTRDGYAEAVRALELLKFDKEEADRRREDTVDSVINFVLHGSNAHDLPGMIRICEDYLTDALVILETKKDARGNLYDVPDRTQIGEAASFINDYSGPVIILVDRCFHELRSMIRNPGRHDATGNGSGCGAGITQICVNADGMLTPCRHLDVPEESRNIDEYIERSKALQKIRSHIADDPLWRPCMENG